MLTRDLFAVANHIDGTLRVQTRRMITDRCPWLRLQYYVKCFLTSTDLQTIRKVIFAVFEFW